MANLKELRNRISSVASTQKITRAMQMVAASKLRKAQDAVESTRPYSDKLFQVVGNLSSEMEGDDNAPKLLVGNGNHKDIYSLLQHLSVVYAVVLIHLLLG